MFQFPPLSSRDRDSRGSSRGLPHSDIDGSLGGRPLPVASRSRPTSFFDSTTPGHSPSAVSRFSPEHALALAMSSIFSSSRAIDELGKVPRPSPA